MLIVLGIILSAIGLGAYLYQWLPFNLPSIMRLAPFGIFLFMVGIESIALGFFFSSIPTVNTVGLFVAALIPPLVVSGIVTYIRGASQSSMIGISAIATIIISCGIGLSTFLASEWELDKYGMLGKVAFLILIIAIAWVIPLTLTLYFFKIT